MLILKPLEVETEDDTQGKMLLLTEYSLLSLLHEQKGVVHHHGLFKVSSLNVLNAFLVMKKFYDRIYPASTKRRHRWSSTLRD